MSGMADNTPCQALASIGYPGQQATLAECRSACECYLHDLQYHMVSFDIGVFEQIWLRLIAEQSSAIELAFLQSIIAIAGCVAPSTHPIAKVAAISGERGYQSRIRTALLHLKSSSPQHWNRSILMIHTLHLISLYYFLTKQFEEAWKYSQGCIKASESVGLLEEEDGVDRSRGTLIRQRLKHDIYTLDGYLAFQNNRPSLLEGKPPSSTRLRRWESPHTDDVSSYWSDVKLQGANLSIQVASRIRQGAASPGELTGGICDLERDIAAFLDASIRGVGFLKMRSKSQDSSLEEAKLSFTSHIATMLSHTLRCMLLQADPTLSSSTRLLQSANSILASLPLCFSLLNSPLQRIQMTTSTFTFVNVAMSSFSQVMEQASSTNLEPCRSEIDTFVKSFDQTYMLLNWMGSVGPYTLRCAEMIKTLPVPKSDGDPLLAAFYENMRQGRPLINFKMLEQ